MPIDRHDIDLLDIGDPLDLDPAVERIDPARPLDIGSRGGGRGLDFINPAEQRQNRGRGPPDDVGVRRHDLPEPARRKPIGLRLHGPPEDKPGKGPK